MTLWASKRGEERERTTRWKKCVFTLHFADDIWILTGFSHLTHCTAPTSIFSQKKSESRAAKTEYNILDEKDVEIKIKLKTILCLLGCVNVIFSVLNISKIDILAVASHEFLVLRGAAREGGDWIQWILMWKMWLQFIHSHSEAACRH